MFIDTAFSRAEKAAGFFTIDLSKDKSKKENTNDSPFKTMLMTFVYTLVDASTLGAIIWLFGASIFTR